MPFLDGFTRYSRLELIFEHIVPAVAHRLGKLHKYYGTLHDRRRRDRGARRSRPVFGASEKNVRKNRARRFGGVGAQTLPDSSPIGNCGRAGGARGLRARGLTRTAERLPSQRAARRRCSRSHNRVYTARYGWPPPAGLAKGVGGGGRRLCGNLASRKSDRKSRLPLSPIPPQSRCFDPGRFPFDRTIPAAIDRKKTCSTGTKTPVALIFHFDIIFFSPIFEV